MISREPVEKVGSKKTQEDQQESDQALKQIEAFAATMGLEPKAYSVGPSTVLILSPRGKSITETQYKKYLAMENKVTLKHDSVMTSNAMFKSNQADGVLESQNAPYRLVKGADNYAVNFDQQDDGSVLAIDLTAGTNVDLGARHFDVLLLRGENLTDLLGKLGMLYGGNWSIKDKR